jgi:protein-S-isoprenylcysteine O-methyltransferase Ste14
MANDRRRTKGKLDRDGWSILIKTLIVLPIYLLILLPAAGTWDYLGAWLYTASLAFYGLLYFAVLGLANPELLNQRGRTFRDDTAKFDYPFFAIWRILIVVTLLVAAIDVRFGWSTVSPPLFWVSFAIVMLSNGLSLWPMVVNPHFEATVRIQEDRNHKVIDRGPYAIVRHPGYALFMPAILFGPLLLESCWALIPSAGIATVFIWRTSREDAMLHRELEGYAEYAERVRYRLLPGIW